MSKRRRASELIFGKKNALKYPVRVTSVASGTGTCTHGGVITVLAASAGAVATSAYVTLDSGTWIGTLIGSTTVIS
jgi:hypothetical protein